MQVFSAISAHNMRVDIRHNNGVWESNQVMRSNHSWLYVTTGWQKATKPDYLYQGKYPMYNGKCYTEADGDIDDYCSRLNERLRQW